MSNSNNASPDTAAILESISAMLPSQVQTPEKVAFQRTSTQEIQQALTRLSARAPRFHSTGSVLLAFTEGGRLVEVPLAIRSVPFDVAARLVAEAYVEPPRTKKMNVETLEFEMVKDEWDPAYQRLLQQANTLFLKRYTLYALDGELEDEHGELVWDPKHGIFRETEALRVLDLQGLTQTHYLQIRQEAEALSMTAKQREEMARTKKF